jgi:hypothetical protein
VFAVVHRQGFREGDVFPVSFFRNLLVGVLRAFAAGLVRGGRLGFVGTLVRWKVGRVRCRAMSSVPSGGHIRIPDNLKAVVLPDISLKSIEKGWAAHLKVAHAVISGRLSETTTIELESAARHGDASFRAGHAHGLLLRTNDLLRSYTHPDYRREKLRYLNRNERTHQLQRQIRHAGSSSTRGKRQEELGAQSHCLALGTNLVMAYNRSHLQRTLDTWRKRSGREVDAWTQRFISPMGFEHINFNGVIVFPFDYYRTQLLSPRWGLQGRSSRVIHPIRAGSPEH